MVSQPLSVLVDEHVARQGENGLLALKVGFIERKLVRLALARSEPDVVWSEERSLLSSRFSVTGPRGQVAALRELFLNHEREVL